jgi:hypothetical protein
MGTKVITIGTTFISTACQLLRYSLVPVNADTTAQ